MRYASALSTLEIFDGLYLERREKEKEKVTESLIYFQELELGTNKRSQKKILKN